VAKGRTVMPNAPHAGLILAAIPLQRVKSAPPPASQNS